VKERRVGCLFLLGQLSTFAEKEVFYLRFQRRNSSKSQVTICPLNPKYDVIFWVRVKLQGACVDKPQEIISHIWEKGDNFLSLRPTSLARKKVCLSSKARSVTRFSRYEWRYEFRYERLAGTQFVPKKCLCDRKKGFWEYESRYVILCGYYTPLNLEDEGYPKDKEY